MLTPLIARRLKVALLVLSGCLVASASPAQAHFLWSAIQTGPDGKSEACLWFSESAEPGEAKLIERIARTEAQLVAAGAAAQPLTFKSTINGDAGALTASVDAAQHPQLVAKLRYGVFTRGDKPLLLWYYARYQDESHLAAGSDSSALPLNLVAATADGQTVARLAWQGKPVEGATVYAECTNGYSEELTTDAAGEVKLGTLKPGLYSLRARHTVEQPGKLDDEAYNAEAHWTTLALRLAAPSAASKKDPVAAKDLLSAREARALWNGFPGFRAKLVVSESGKSLEGTLTVKADGTVAIDGFENTGVQRTLESLVSHRLSDTGFEDEVSFADDDANHPLGRLVSLDYDSAMGSAYRLKGDVVAEVNRQMGSGGRFTISVLDVYRNAEGKYLPANYTVNTWNKAGDLISSTTVSERYERVGQWDLPVRHLSVRSGKEGKQSVSEMVFSDVELLEAGK